MPRPCISRGVTPSRRGSWLTALLSITGLALTQAGCLQQLIGGCTDVGCGDIVFNVAELPNASLAGLDGAWVEACLNEDCVGRQVPLVPGRLTLNPDDPGQHYVNAELIPNAATGTLDITVLYLAGYGRLGNGDVFETRLVSVDSELLVGRSWSVARYQTTTPNGSDCEPTCRYPSAIEAL